MLKLYPSEFVQSEKPDNVFTLPNSKINESDDLEDIKRLAGITKIKGYSKHFENISHTAMEKAKLMKEHNIRPGTPEWFKLWFSLPYLTNEKPIKES